MGIRCESPNAPAKLIILKLKISVTKVFYEWRERIWSGQEVAPKIVF
jgi:hypothetical protein